MLEGAKSRGVNHPKLNLQVDLKGQEGLGSTCVVRVKPQTLSFFEEDSPGLNELGGCSEAINNSRLLMASPM